ncbi:MAG TPA: hypothetical protein VGG06_10345, partial [Thermoanaerobaculia bacterium]
MSRSIDERSLPWQASLALLLLATLAATAGAQPFPSQQLGLSADTSYQSHGLDQINLFNGQLVLNLALGSTYAAGPDLDYGLALSYNSNGWAHEERSCNAQSYTLPVPRPRSNAGFGWALEVGRVLAPNEAESGRWTFLSPDGGEHGFYTELHPGYPSTPQGNTWFSTDGSYLRLKRFPSGSTQCASAVPAGLTADCLLLEMPDGTIHELRSFAAAGGGDYRLTQMRDRHGNAVDLEHPGAGTELRLRDGHGRLQRIIFDGPASGPQKVTRVELTSFGGATATYDFVYAQQTLDRQGYLNPPACAEPGQVTVDVLQRIIQPDGSFYEMSYYTQDGAPEVLSGGLKSLRLPTRGEYRWTYTPITFFSQDPAETRAEWIRRAYGVATKEIFERFGQTTPLATWTYAYATSGPQVP